MGSPLQLLPRTTLTALFGPLASQSLTNLPSTATPSEMSLSYSLSLPLTRWRVFGSSSDPARILNPFPSVGMPLATSRPW